jgi:CRP/FNR family transcriptional regulator, cyclic AMP receptor protein
VISVRDVHRPVSSDHVSPRFLQEFDVFRRIAAAEVQSIARRTRRLALRPGERLFAEGDLRPRGLYVVASGKVKLVSRSSGGERVHTLLGPNQCFGVPGVIEERPHSASAIAVGPTLVLGIDANVVRESMAASPELRLRLLEVVAQRLREADATHADQIFIDVYGRLAKQLLMLAQRFGVTVRGRVRVQHELTQAELAQLVGTSRETVNKAMGEFAERGWIRVHAGTVMIDEPELLARRAGAHSPRAMLPPQSGRSLARKPA